MIKKLKFASKSVQSTPKFSTMANPHLHITLIQANIVWEDKNANLAYYEREIAALDGPRHVIVLPEMFSTGFSMNAEALAEAMDGPSVAWMARIAVQYRCILAGSLIIAEEGKYYNRMLWVQPDGTIGHYDKRHLFAYAGEDEHYTRGENRLIAQVNGWRVNLLVCYDLRFPVWARNTGDDYDVLVYVANWPQQRSLAWKTLLQARAIENMSYVVGVNRVGIDGKGFQYSGDSSVFGPLGDPIWLAGSEPATHTVTLDKESLLKTRSHLPFLKDADKFMLL